jgi:hypothetical protein
MAMGLLDALKGLFAGGGSGGGDEPGEVVEYQGYRITPAPQKTGGGWNTAGLIAKDFEDGTKEHHFIRVDTHHSRDDALAFSVTKAQQIIDEQGDRIFRERR